jgi:hypothetical protein
VAAAVLSLSVVTACTSSAGSGPSVPPTAAPVSTAPTAAPVSTAPSAAPVSTAPPSGSEVFACPVAGIVAAGLGVRVGPPRSTAGPGTVTCSYAVGPSAGSFQITYGSVADGSASTFQITLQRQAAAAHTAAVALPGFGQTAFLFTTPGGRADHPATSVLGVQLGSRSVRFSGPVSVLGLETVARNVLTR